MSGCGRHLAGIERADSVPLDPHKGLFTPYPSSYVVFRERGVLTHFSRHGEAVLEDGCWDLGLIMPFLGSRGFESLSTWMLLKHVGVEALGALVESRQALVRYLDRRLEESGLFVRLNDVDFYRLAFVCCPPRVRAALKALSGERRERAVRVISEYTSLLNAALYRDGRVCFDEHTLIDLGDRVGLGSADAGGPRPCHRPARGLRSSPDRGDAGSGNGWYGHPYRRAARGPGRLERPVTRVADPGRARDEVGRFLTDTLGSSLVAAFVYGSVATGTARPGSDLDCFTLTARALPASTRSATGVSFSTLQRTLGYTPDPAYPIELFSARHCWTALRGPVVAEALRQARERGRLDLPLSGADEVEVLRALLGARLTVTSATALDRLTHAAHVLVEPYLGQPFAKAGRRESLLAALGVKSAVPGRPTLSCRR